MPTFNDKKVVVNVIESLKAGFTHTEQLVTKTATMGFGSILDAAGAEIAAAASATGEMVIDDPRIDELADGETIVVSVAVRGCSFDGSALKFSDAAYAGEALDALEAKLCFVE